MKPYNFIGLLFGIATALFIFSPIQVQAEDNSSTVVAPASQVLGTSSRATVTNIIGEAKYAKKGQADWLMLEKDMTLFEGDSVRTAKDSIVMIELLGTEKTADLVIKPESHFTLQTFSHDPDKKVEHTLLSIQAGSVLVKAQKLIGDSKFEVKTPTYIVGIRGTTFEVQVEKS